MGRILWAFIILICSAVGVEAQVTPGTVFSKTEDGLGNKITSTVAGPSRGIDVNCLGGSCGGASITYLDADGIVNQTVSGVHGQGYMYNGATWDRVRGDTTNGLWVNCKNGCAGGSSTPGDAFANPTTAGIQQDFLMGYNGATWDRIRATIAGGVLVNVSNASLAVTGTFWQVTQPVSGTVAVSNAFLLDATFTARINTLGQKTMANSTPVVLSSDQTSIPVAATVSNAFVLDSTFTGRFTAGAVDADTIANETTTSVHGKCYLYNGVTWDRCRGAIGTGLLVNISNATLAVTQSGTWNIGTITALTSITNPVAVTGTFWQATQPVSGTLTVIQGTGTNLHIVCDSGCGGAASFADSSAFTFATTAVNNMGAVVDDTATNVVAENSAGAPRMHPNRILYGLPTNNTGTALYPSAAVEADAIANPTLTQIGTFLHGYNGTTWDRLKSTTANGLAVDVTRVTGNVAVTNAGLTNIDVALSTRVAEATFTGRFPAAYADADSIANQTTTAIHGQNYVYNPGTVAWDRMRSPTADGVTISGLLSSGSMVFNSATWDRVREPTADTLSPIGLPAAGLSFYNGATWDRARGTVTGGLSVSGVKSNNGGVPGATNLGVLPCIANAAAPTNTEGNQTLCSQNLNGAQRTIEQNFVATSNSDGSCPSGAASFTVIASNASRTWLAVWASPANTDDVYIKLAATATNADARFAPGQTLNFTSGRIYTGIIDAFPNSGTQAVCVMELN